VYYNYNKFKPILLEETFLPLFFSVPVPHQLMVDMNSREVFYRKKIKHTKYMYIYCLSGSKYNLDWTEYATGRCHLKRAYCYSSR